MGAWSDGRAPLRDLMEAVRDGDKEAAEEMARRLTTTFVGDRLAGRLNPHDADDVHQDWQIRALQIARGDGYRGPDLAREVGGYMRRSMRNTILTRSKVMHMERTRVMLLADLTGIAGAPETDGQERAAEWLEDFKAKVLVKVARSRHRKGQRCLYLSVMRGCYYWIKKNGHSLGMIKAVAEQVGLSDERVRQIFNEIRELAAEHRSEIDDA